MKKVFSIGPGTLITAAFIGPGTVTVCTLAGVQFGYTLLWALLFSVVVCVILQEMTARLGVVTQQGLSAVLRSQFKDGITKWLFTGLILSAIVVGNAAYEAGNISGGVLGLSTVLESTSLKIAGHSFNYVSILIGVAAFILLYIGNYKVIERSLIVLVLLMSVSFIVSAIATKPDLLAVFKGFSPSLESEKLYMVISLIGTTVVPYNLFLHASIVKEKWKTSQDLKEVRKDTISAIALGGIVSMSILISGAAVQQTEVINAADLARSLEPIFGSLAKYVLSIGLLAAGITSAITAPLAAAYVVKGCLGWSGGLKSTSFRLVWISILLVGVVLSSLGLKPIEIITFAQVTNGILLPVMAVFLLWVMNRKEVLGNHTNSLLQNIAGMIIIVVTVFLGGKSIWSVLLG